MIYQDGKIGIQEFSLLPLVFAYFSCTKQADTKQKLGEEYQHKASLTEYLAGYKQMWKLERSDQEYITLIEDIKKEILKNPSTFLTKGKDYIDNIQGLVKQTGETIKEIK